MGAKVSRDGPREATPPVRAWPVLAAWRLHRPGRAVAQLVALALPLVVLGLVHRRAAVLLGSPHGDGITALVVLAALVVALPLSTVYDAARLVHGGRPPGWTERLTRNRSAAIGITIVVVFALVALLAPLLAPYDPLQIGDLSTAAYRPPGLDHWLGTDQFGRDVLSRTLYGARISLWIGLLAATLAVGVGTGVGLAAGYTGGRTDGMLMRGVDVLLAFPRLFLVLLLAGLLRPSAGLVVVALGLTGWMTTARLVRAQVRSLRGGGWVEAAQALGIPTARILGRHVLPNVAAPILVSATLMVGQTILTESALSFLGLGVQVPTPSWGQMIDEGRKVFPQVWWVSLFPGIAITLTVVGYNLLGDALRDELDPRWRARGRGWLP
jgi:peptide/nickel transport system permease protein